MAPPSVPKKLSQGEPSGGLQRAGPAPPPGVAAVLAPLIEAGPVATCGVIEFELGWATRTSAELDQLRTDRDTG